MPKTAFFAYPADPALIGGAISEAIPEARQACDLIITPWPKLKIIGLKLDDLIRDKILMADFLLADVTYPNFNVYYEIGYAVGQQKLFVLTVNYTVEKATANVNLTGLFDTLGQLKYQNAHELVEQFKYYEAVAWTNQYLKVKDHTQPLFLLDALRKIDFRNYIVQTVANSHVQARKFDPEEVPRLSLSAAIGDVSASAGIIVPLISTQISDWERHNLRGAFITGLCHGLDIEPLIIQYEDVLPRSTIETLLIRHEAGARLKSQ